MSWADATDEEEIQQPQRPSNAWQKPNPWAAPAQKKEEPKSSIVDDSDFPLPGKEKAPREQGSSNGKSNDDRRDDRRDERRDERRDDYRRRDDRPRDEYRREERRDDRPRDDYRPREDREDRGERRPYGAPRERREREFYGHDDREDRRSSDRDDDRFGGSRRGGFGKGGFNRREPREQRPREPREPVPLPTQAPFTAFVGNLPFTIVADQLHEFFSAENCKVAHIRIIAGNDGKPKGYGYVEFEDLESLKAAIELNGQPLFERELKIDVAEAKPKQEERSSWKKRDSSPPRAESGNSPSEGAKERPKIALQPRSEAPKPAAPSDAYKSAKSNPFGEAKPRDENEILKKKEEERKQRETTGPKEAEEEVAPKTEEKPREEPFRPAVRKEDRPPRREDNRREDRPPRRDDNRRDDRPPRRDDNRRDDRPPRRDDNRPPRRDDNRPPRRDDNRRDDRPPRRDDRPPRQPNNSTSVPAAKRAPWAPKQEEPKAVQSANIFGLLQEEDL